MAVFAARKAERTVIVTVQKNFGKPVEWALIKDHAWSTAQLRRLDVPVSLPVHRRATLSSKDHSKDLPA